MQWVWDRDQGCLLQVEVHQPVLDRECWDLVVQWEAHLWVLVVRWGQVVQWAPALWVLEVLWALGVLCLEALGVE